MGPTCVRLRQAVSGAKEIVVPEILKKVALRLASYKVPEGLQVVEFRKDW